MSQPAMLRCAGKDEIVDPVVIQNQFKIGYGARFKLLPQDSSEKWGVAFQAARRQPQDLKFEGILAASELAAEHTTAPAVFFSGGIDSEFMLNCFVEAGAPFKAFTVEFKNNLNRHDMEYVDKWEKQNPKIEVNRIAVDIEKFLQSEEASELADQTKSILPHLLLLMSLAKKSDRPVIYGTGEPYLLNQNGNWALRERESIAALYRFFKMQDIRGSHAFFQHNPEIFLAYLKNPVCCDLVSGLRVGKQSSLTSRIDIYSQYFNIEARPKFHGYEKIEALTAEIQTKLEHKHNVFNNHRYFDYQEVVKKMSASGQMLT